MQRESHLTRVKNDDTGLIVSNERRSLVQNEYMQPVFESHVLVHLVSANFVVENEESWFRGLPCGSLLVMISSLQLFHVFFTVVLYSRDEHTQTTTIRFILFTQSIKSVSMMTTKKNKGCMTYQTLDPTSTDDIGSVDFPTLVFFTEYTICGMILLFSLRILP